MCYILCMCVCVGASDTTTVSDDTYIGIYCMANGEIRYNEKERFSRLRVSGKDLCVFCV
jgi:hypothetical protein